MLLILWLLPFILQELGQLKLLLYFDEADQWPAVYHNDTKVGWTGTGGQTPISCRGGAACWSTTSCVAFIYKLFNFQLSDFCWTISVIPLNVAWQSDTVFPLYIRGCTLYVHSTMLCSYGCTLLCTLPPYWTTEWSHAPVAFNFSTRANKWLSWTIFR